MSRRINDENFIGDETIEVDKDCVTLWLNLAWQLKMVNNRNASVPLGRLLNDNMLSAVFVIVCMLENIKSESYLTAKIRKIAEIALLLID